MPGSATAARRLDLERGNLRTAMRHLVDVGDADLATDIAWRLYLYWWLRGFFYEVGVWMRELLERVPDASDHARAVARFFDLWSAMWTTDEGAEVVAGLQEAADLFAASGDEFGEAMAARDEGLRADHARAARRRRHRAPRGLRGELPRARGAAWAETLALIALGRVAGGAGPAGRGASGYFDARSRRPRPAATRSRRPSRATTSRACGCSPATRMPPPAASPTPCGISMALEHDEGIAYAIEGLCAVAALRGDVEVAATLAGAAETTRQRITMFDAPQFVYHLRLSRRGDDARERRRRPRGDGPRTGDVGRRGRRVRAGERRARDD